MAWSTPTSRSDGYVVPAATWNQDVVDNPVALRAGALAITSQGANTLIYGSSSTQLAALAAGTQGAILYAGASGLPTWASPPHSICQGRVTLTTAVPVTTSDVTGASTIYFSPHNGNEIALYTGSIWRVFATAELSIATSGGTASKPHDVFVDYNSGTPALAILAWTNDTTRATALTTQDGVLVKTGATGQRYVGTVYLDGSKNCEDSYAKRHVWNYHHRVARPMRVLESTDSWNYTTATMRQANGAAANQLDFVCGVAEDAVEAQVLAHVSQSDAGVSITSAIGLDSTSAAATGCLIANGLSTTAAAVMNRAPSLRTIPTAGRHTLVWLEYSGAGVGTTTWYGDGAAATLLQSGIHGMWRG